VTQTSLGLAMACAVTVVAAGTLSAARQETETMRAVVVVDGKPVVQSLAVPSPGPGEVLIKVHAAAVNPMDWKSAARAAGGGGVNDAPVVEGTASPKNASTARPSGAVPGFDAAGVIDRIGDGVTDWKGGDEVIAFSEARGAYAEFVVVPARTIVRKPKALTFQQASGIPTVAFAAYNALFDVADIKRGQRVLVHGGAGGVGSAAVQLAKSRGAFVLATASARNHEFLKAIGADQAIDYTSAPFESLVSALDVVLNTVDSETATRSIVAIKRGGTLVSIAGQPAADACERAGVRCLSRKPGTPVAEVMAHAAQLAEDGKYIVHVDATLPLARTAEAWAKSQTGRTRGKIILTMN
jgi:NADPH:quinone reductase-like Zn-dependent oxidoreductase